MVKTMQAKVAKDRRVPLTSREVAIIRRLKNVVKLGDAPFRSTRHPQQKVYFTNTLYRTITQQFYNNLQITMIYGIRDNKEEELFFVFNKPRIINPSNL